VAEAACVALGFRVHLGWAAGVALGAGRPLPRVLARTRIELADPEVPHSREPYHAAEELAREGKLREAERLLDDLTRVVKRVAKRAVRSWVRELGVAGGRIAGSAVLTGVGRPGSSLAATLASHALVHTAEGLLFREALLEACGACGLAVSATREREVYAAAARALRLPEELLRERIDELGRPLGAPWRQDQKLATAAAWRVLRRTSV
jgi:hypothetical protein